jgi:mono/diheme cytochrome c family protein
MTNTTTRAVVLFTTLLLLTSTYGIGQEKEKATEKAAPPQQMPDSDKQFQTLIRSVQGPDLFRAYCASCHGADAKGNGPAASALKTKVPDLTMLTKNNRGQFPSARVRKAIMGDDVVAAHGSREMPVWGPIFHQIERDVDRGYVRLDNLVKYLKSIQSVQEK